MFIALYEMVAKPGQEKPFEAAWSEVTIAIYEVRGSLGSRLHLTETPGTYVAYAQWPSAEVFDGHGEYSASQQPAFQKLKATTESIRLVQRLEVIKDLLKADTFP